MIGKCGCFGDGWFFGDTLLTLGCRLLQEERGGKWLYSVDQMAPIEI